MLHALGVLVGAEDGDLLVAGKAEGLQPFVGLLPVVEGGRHAVHAQVGVGDELEGRPFARLDRVVGFDVTVDCEVKNAKVSGLFLFALVVQLVGDARQGWTGPFLPPKDGGCTDVSGLNDERGGVRITESARPTVEQV